MAVYIVTGKLGGGKTLCSVGIIRDALLQGRKVATNIDLNVEHLLPWQRKNITVFRLPDQLSADSFEVIGSGNNSYDEEMNGLLVLDEGGLSLNSRDYREKGRKEFIKWGVHSRKMGWDMYIIIQHIDALDKQIRDLFGEHVVTCSRFDRMRLPLVGGLLQFLGFKGTYGKLHQATCRYGQNHQAMVTWRKRFVGNDLYQAYDTRQTYDPENGAGVTQLLSPYLVKGRYHNRRDELRNFYRRLWNDYALFEVKGLSLFFCAALLGGWVHASFTEPDIVTAAAPVEQGTEMVISLPVEIDSDVIEPEPEIDPWEGAYISSYLGNTKTKDYKYWFRDLFGQALRKPADFTWFRFRLVRQY